MTIVRSERRSPRIPRAGSLKARTTLTVAVLVLLGACGTDAADDDRASSAAYTSPVYGYSISHPRSWSVVEARSAALRRRAARNVLRRYRHPRTRRQRSRQHHATARRHHRRATRR